MLPPDLRDMELKLQELTREGAAAVQAQDYERAAQLKDQSDKIQADLRHGQGRLARRQGHRRRHGGRRRHRRRWSASGPASRCSACCRRRPTSCSPWRTTSTAASSARSVRWRRSARPCAAPAPASRTRSGPSARSSSSAPPGVGKTELARALAEFLFDDEARPDPPRHERVHGEAHRLPAHRRAARLRRATTRAASSPRRSAGGRTASSSSTRSRRRTRTSSTPCCRSSTTAASPTARAARSTSRTPW